MSNVQGLSTYSVSVGDSQENSVNPIFLPVWTSILPLSYLFVLTLNCILNTNESGPCLFVLWVFHKNNLELLGNVETTLPNTSFLRSEH